MAIEFRNAALPPLRDFSISAPDGAIIGIVGERGSGDTALLRLAAGLEQPASGEVIAPESRRYLAITDALNFAPVSLLIVEHSFASADALVRARAAVALDRLRASGTTILMASHEPDLLRNICDEVWWLEAGKLEARGDPRHVLDQYGRHISDKFRAWGATLSMTISPALRKGDGRAEILALETIDSTGKLSPVLRSGEDATVRVTLQFREAVENPVVGIMIRTRIGLEVYGTNTELERVNLGPCVAGDKLRVDFRFACNLCPKEYTLTAASHDPDGTAHDWIDDAVAFMVTDSRQTAGVANLRAQVSVAKL